MKILLDKEKLKQKSEKVSVKEGLQIAAKLILELEQNENGIGLSAPQVEIFKRVFVVKENKNSIPIAFINPKIIDKKWPFVNKDEGCLSFPNQYVDTIRYKNITAIDDLNKNSYLLKGLKALVFQHEFDHLEGRLMFDNKVPDKYDLCFCGSDKKYKFCHYKEVKDNAGYRMLEVDGKK